jgi:bacteriocin-like protein
MNHNNKRETAGEKLNDNEMNKVNGGSLQPSSFGEGDTGIMDVDGGRENSNPYSVPQNTMKIGWNS